jgi:hypothetical protein
VYRRRVSDFRLGRKPTPGWDADLSQGVHMNKEFT